MAAQRMAAVVVREVGGISKLLLDSRRAIPAMARDQVLVRNAYAGLNMYVKYEKQANTAFIVLPSNTSASLPPTSHVHVHVLLFQMTLIVHGGIYAV